MARPALFLLALACAAHVALAKPPVFSYWSQCGGTGGFFNAKGADEAMYSCAEGSICERQNEFWWECVPQAATSPEPIFPCTPLSVVLEERADLAAFYSAVNATGFLPFLTNVHGPVTVLAPTNLAFARWLNASATPDVLTLAKVIQAHMAPGQLIKLGEVTTGSLLYPALEGAELEVKRTGDGQTWSTAEVVVLKNGQGVEAGVIERDVQTCRSMLQVIDAVLVPEL